MFLEGSIPKELGKLTTLELVDMTFNDNLSGTFPEALCELTILKALFLGYTQISGEIPACIAKLTLLRSFFVRFIPSSCSLALVPVEAHVVVLTTVTTALFSSL
jgi:hypothetical protein